MKKTFITVSDFMKPETQAALAAQRVATEKAFNAMVFNKALTYYKEFARKCAEVSVRAERHDPKLNCKPYGSYEAMAEYWKNKGIEYLKECNKATSAWCTIRNGKAEYFLKTW